MGNKLAHPDTITSQDIATYQATSDKKEHVVRLWVDLFNVKEDDSPDADLQWYKITEDVVPASITCIYEDPSTIYNIKAYNSQVEKICDIRIIQPGTKLKQPTECFIHLKDALTEQHWGFNFTSADDAAKFRDTCLARAWLFSRQKSMSLSVPAVAKSSSFGTFRLPGKKWKTGSTRDVGGAKRSDTQNSLSSLSSSAHRHALSNDINGMVTAPSRVISSTMSLDRRELRRKKKTVGLRQNHVTRVDSRSIFANQLDASTMNKQTEFLPAPPCLSLIAENSQTIAAEDNDALISNNKSSRTHSSVDDKGGSSLLAPPIDRSTPTKISQTLNSTSIANQIAKNDEQEEREEGGDITDTSSESGSLYDKPATLSDAHLNAILFSCENIASAADREPQRTGSQHDVISEEDENLSVEEDADATLLEENSTMLAYLSSTSPDMSSNDVVLTPSSPVSPSNNLDSTSEKDNSKHISSSGHNELNTTNDSTLHRMLQSLPSISASNASFGIEAELGDPSITAPLQGIVHPADNSSDIVLRTPSNSSKFRSSRHCKKSEDSHSLISSSGVNNNLRSEYEQHIRNQEVYESSKTEEDDYNSSLYQDSGFGGTVSTEKSASIKSSKSKMSRQSSKMSSSGKSQSSIVTGSGSVYSSSSSSQLTRTDDITQVKPFTLQSDQSGDDDDNSSVNSFTTQPAVIKSYTSLARTSGSTRKTGWLEVKNWLMHSKKKLTLANKRHWKRYWVTLRGTTLMFYSCDDQASLTDEAMPRHIIYIDGSIAQSVPEHPKRENIFSVSSAYGDAYLFQAQTQIEHDNWITSIHSACAAQHARQNGKSNPLKVIQSEIEKLQEHIDSDSKMKKMAELQLTVVKELKSRSAVTKQIKTWEDNLECLFMDQYRFRCYLSSLQGTELPNPKYILTSMSRSTKQKLGKLGILNATSFHSLICIRTPTAYNTYLDQKQKKGLLSTLRQNSSQQSRLKVTTENFLPSPTGSDEGEECSGNYDSEGGASPPELNDNNEFNVSLGSKFGENLARILIPNNQSIVVATDEDMSVRDVLETVCSKRQLVFDECFLRIRTKFSSDYTVPDLDDLFDALINNSKQKDYERVEICPKAIFQVELVRSAEKGFGVEVEAELADDAETEDELKAFVDDVEEGGPAQKAGIIIGDELLILNEKVVSELDKEYIDLILESETHICMTIRSCRLKKPDNITNHAMLTKHADTYIDNMMCPPPPLQSRLSESIIGDLIVQPPSWVHNIPEEDGDAGDTPLTPRAEKEKNVTNIKELLHSAEQVTHLCRMAHERLDSEDVHPIILPSVQPLSEAQKLRKVILELIDTERSYVRDLSMLMERYLEPLKEETFLSSEEVGRLVGNIQEIVHFQKEFLKNLEESIEDDSFMRYTSSLEFKKVLFSIAGSFIYYANHFKLYSSFCASHSRAQKVLSPGDNSELYEFLHARNPKQQHSATLESYLIKPIQRILKYPLLLQQLRVLTDPDSNEFTHLNDALKAMENVAEHINEMQKIYEEFGLVFDDLTKAHPGKQTLHGNEKKKLELNVGDLQYYGEANWLNACHDISKPKKGCEHVTTVFVFKHGVVLLCQEKLKGKPGKHKNGSNSKGIMLDCGFETAYCKFLPVTEIQVRTLPTTHAGGPVALWELLYLKSTIESRPEKIYHMACSDVDKRSEFLKYMRLIIRESVKRMTVPKTRLPLETEVKLRHSTINPIRHSCLETVKLRHSATTDHSDSDCTSSSSKTHTDNRYSMNLDCDRLAIPELDLQGQRSRTYGDLVDFCDGGSMSIRNTSINSVDSDTSHSSAAVLVYSSQDPITYSSKGSLTYGGEPGSPVWEKRSDNNITESLNMTHISTKPFIDITETRRGMNIRGLYLDTATEC